MSRGAIWFSGCTSGCWMEKLGWRIILWSGYISVRGLIWMNSQLRHLSVLAFGTRGEMVNYLCRTRPVPTAPAQAPPPPTAALCTSTRYLVHTVELRLVHIFTCLHSWYVLGISVCFSVCSNQTPYLMIVLTTVFPNTSLTSKLENGWPSQYLIIPS